MQFDDILVQIGVYGKYQKFMCLMLGLTAIPLAWHAIAQVFLAAETDHWCVVPTEESLNCSSLSPGQLKSECWEAQKNLSIPYTRDDDGDIVYSQCDRYLEADTTADEVASNVTYQTAGDKRESIPCDSGWDFDRSQYTSTVQQSFDLVCSKKDMPSLAQSIFFAGILTGSFVCGAMADWIGRRPTFFISLLIGNVATIVTSVAPNFATYTAMRFFIAAANFGVYLMAFVLVTEIVGPSYRTMVGTILAIFFSVGYALLSLFAYLLRDWRHLQLAISVPMLFLLSYIIFLPESPRWLICKKKYKQVEQVIKKIAKYNGTEAPAVIFDKEDLVLETQTTGVSVRRPTQLDLFRTPNMRKKSLNIFFNWFVNSLVYYGLSLSTSGLGINVYMASFVSGAVELPGYLCSWYAIQKWGRRISIFAFLVVGGVACLTTIFIPHGIARAAVAMVGKFGISGSFNIIYIYSIELYPTPIRSMGMGMSSMSARISGVVAPVILLLGRFWEPIPLIIFGVCSILAGILALLLPETLDHNLPETIQEGEDFGKGQGFALKELFKLKHDPRVHGDDGGQDIYKPVPQAEEKKAAAV